MEDEMGTYKKCVQNLGWKTEGKGPLGKPRRRWEDSIKMALKGIVVRVWTGFIWL
jgi:hypothetical protein